MYINIDICIDKCIYVFIKKQNTSKSGTKKMMEL